MEQVYERWSVASPSPPPICPHDDPPAELVLQPQPLQPQPLCTAKIVVRLSHPVDFEDDEGAKHRLHMDGGDLVWYGTHHNDMGTRFVDHGPFTWDSAKCWNSDRFCCYPTESGVVAINAAIIDERL